MKKFLSLVLSFCILALLLPALPVSATTEGPYTEGDYTYTVTDGEATITSFYPKPYPGALTIPNSLGGYPVTAIGTDAFYGCYGITSFTFPATLKTIEDYAFSYCTALTSITIPEGVTHIGTSAFLGCERVTSIVLPDSVTYMGTGAFSWCGKATSINIPAGVTSLPERVFYHMPSLQSIIIPKTITAIGTNLFSVAPKDIYYTGTEAEWNAISIESPNNALEDATIHFTEDVPPRPTEAPATEAPTEGPFYWEADFRETNATQNGSTISYREDTGLSMICRDNGCSPFSAQWSATPFINAYHPTSYTLYFTARQTGGVKGNPWEGFSIVVYYNSTHITSLIHFVPNTSGGVDLYANGTMGPNVASVDTSYHSYSISFNEKEGKITSLKIDGTEQLTSPISWTAPPLYESVGINYNYGLTSYDSTPCEFYITELSIGAEGYIPPGEPTDEPTEEPTYPPQIYEIPAPRVSVESDVVPYGTVVRIEPVDGHFSYYINGEFYYSYDFYEDITIYEDTVLRVVSWKDVMDPNVTYIGSEATYTYTVDPDTIPTEVPTDEPDDFYDLFTWGLSNEEITILGFDPSYEGELTIPSTHAGYPVTKIGACAFKNCSSLTSVTVPSSVTFINYEAFAGCEALESIHLPDSINFIGADAFNGTALTRISVPANMTIIFSSTFRGCQDLTFVSISERVTSIREDAFADCPSLTDVGYSGTEYKWNMIDIRDGNDALLNATLHPIVIEYPEGPPEIVAAPTVLPAACEFNDSIDVTLSCSTPGANIYYSLSFPNQDIETPAVMWLYTEPIQLTYTTILSAYAEKYGVMSEWVTATFTNQTELTTEPPTTEEPTEEPTAPPTTPPTEEPVGELSVSKSSVSIKVGKSVSVNAYLGDVDITDSATWNSKKDSIATVENGTITGVKAGTTKVSVSYGDQIKQIEVEVKSSGGSGGGGGGGSVRPTAAPTAAPTTAPTEAPTQAPGQSSVPFKDVSESDWYFDAVSFAYESGLMNGVAEEEFSPESTITRAMFVTVLYRMAGEPTSKSIMPFTDVPAGSYYEKAVLWATENGIVSGISETAFTPDMEITREQMATMIYRYAKMNGYGIAGGDGAPFIKYADSSDISEYAIMPFVFCTESGIINGMDDNTLRPKENATRAQAATIFMRLENVLFK